MAAFQPAQTDDPEDAKKARRKAMDLLARRDYGYEELIERLQAAGFQAAVAADVVQVLNEEGLQDDMRFAAALCSAHARKGKGPLRVELDLRNRQIVEPVIADALREAEIDWYEVASRARRLRFGDAAPADFPNRAKQMRFLQYRGFDTVHIQAAFPDRPR